MKIAIVNDMIMAVEALRRVLSLSKHIKVVWIANNGVQAVEKCRAEKPDLILMDLIMPEMDGVEATRIIMKQTPCPILIVTSSVEGNAETVFRAMGAGALDAINTPTLSAFNNSEIDGLLLEKINKIAFLLNSTQKKPVFLHSATNNHVAHDSNISLVVVGASSGGPQALEEILTALPNNFSVPIIIVQHVDEEFTPELVAWLDSICGLQVKLAHEYEKIKKGNVYIAAKNDHLVMTYNGIVHYSNEPAELAYKPSVDVFFNSVAKNWSGKVIGVLLTGMGVDGAEGLLQLRNRGDFTITQDKQSCAVYGMPKAANEIDAAIEILPLKNIANRIVSLIQ